MFKVNKTDTERRQKCQGFLMISGRVEVKINLRRYDTIKISLYFPELLIIGKYEKIRFKDRGSPCYC